MQTTFRGHLDKNHRIVAEYERRTVTLRNVIIRKNPATFESGALLELESNVGKSLETTERCRSVQTLRLEERDI